MKYAIIVNGKVTEPVCIPPSREGDPLAWLAQQMHSFPGPWTLVSEDAVPGATFNSPGSSTNPPSPAPANYLKLDRGARLEIMSAVFADARVNAIHDAFALLSTDVMKAAYRKFMSDTYKASRQELIDLFTALRANDVPSAVAKITVAEITAIADHQKWITG